PDRWWSYEGVDAIVLATSDEAFLDKLTSPQIDAIAQWVRLGGRLILCVGARGEKLLAEGGPWAALAPGKLADVSPLRDGTGLETFTASKLPHGEERYERDRPLVSRLTDASGTVLVEEGGAISANRPLIVHAPRGLGQVTYVGIDLDHPALASWKGRPSLIARLLQGKEPREQSDREANRSVTHLGYEDLVGQLRAALDQVPTVKIVNFTTVSILTIVYLLLIGPGDFLLLSRLGWPRQVTWFTFPLVAIALGAVAWLFGSQSHGEKVRLNQAELVDIDASSGVARGTVWAHLYSPATDHFDLQMQIEPPPTSSPGNAAQPQGWLAWQGLPGESMGGLASRQVSLAAADPYSISLPRPQPTMENLPVQVASSKSLSGRWWAQVDVQAKNQLAENQYGVVTGTFEQPLPFELTDCLLIHGEKLYRLGKLPAGHTVHMDDFAPLNLEARLTERTVVLSKDVSTPWRKDLVDVPRILLMMMFHEAARGSSFTGLTNRYQPYVDLTEQVRLGRAVLVGRTEKGACQIHRGDRPLADPSAVQTWTWYRVILPVGKEQPEQPTNP
ncbi:MAG TPA: hypothetical protein VFV87_20430, partial [Pirellulaceae bacterium]|nr:hypothetical protein [Pirellulaceae bacterium]